MNGNNNGAGLTFDENEGTGNPAVGQNENLQQPNGYAPYQNEGSTTYDNGFNLFQSGFLSTQPGSELTAKYSKGILEFIEKIKRTGFKVSELDNATITNLKYSSIIISAVNGPEVLYYTLLIAATGKASHNVKDYFNVLSDAERMSLKDADEAVRSLYLPYIAFDNDYKAAIEAKLDETYGTKYKYVSLDGFIIHEDVVDSEDLYRHMFAKAFNAFHAETKMSDGVGDATIENIARSANYRIASNGCRNSVSALTPFGAAVRTDWQLSLIPQPRKQSSNSIHTEGAVGPILTVGGFVDAIPEQTMIQEGFGQIAGIRYHPHIIVTNVASAYETTGMALLAITVGVSMVKPEMYLASLSPRAKNNPGALNVFANLANNPNGGEFLDMTTAAYTPDAIMDSLSKMFTLAPVFSIDIETFGPDAYTLSAFTSLTKENPTTFAGAAAYLVNVASKLTKGMFPTEYDLNKVIAGFTRVPTGSYIDHGSNVPSDIRDFDMIRVVNESVNNPKLIYKWYNSNTNPNGYNEKVEVLAAINPGAKITGEARRVTLHPEFIATLVNAVSANNLRPSATPEVELQTTNGFVGGGFFATAGVTNVGFGNFGGFGTNRPVGFGNNQATFSNRF